MTMIYSCVAQLHVVDTNEYFSCQHEKTQAPPINILSIGLAKHSLRRGLAGWKTSHNLAQCSCWRGSMEGIPKMKRMAHQGMTLSKGTCLSHVRFGRGGLLGCVGLGGGEGQGVWVSRRVGALLGRCCGGCRGWGGSTHNWISSSAHPSHPNSRMYSTTVECPQVLKFLFFMLSKKEGTANLH